MRHLLAVLLLVVVGCSNSDVQLPENDNEHFDNLEMNHLININSEYIRRKIQNPSNCNVALFDDGKDRNLYFYNYSKIISSMAKNEYEKVFNFDGYNLYEWSIEYKKLFESGRIGYGLDYKDTYLGLCNYLPNDINNGSVALIDLMALDSRADGGVGFRALAVDFRVEFGRLCHCIIDKRGRTH